ncbi:MAG: ribbon-helix-helix domain-containing protein [Methermicoccaceae archaeon]
METQQSEGGSTVVAVRLSSADVAMLDRLVSEGKYYNRSDAVRGLLRRR